jgi:CO/xanthine dehydrogenase FAD-binding subunit
VSRAVSPSSLKQAIDYLAGDPTLIPTAGCTDLMVCEPEQRASLPGVMNLLDIPELRGIRSTDGGLEIGATTSFTEIRSSAEVRQSFPALAAAARVIGGWQIQNRATLGGNMANASPAGDSLPVLLALEATVVVVGPGGERQVPYGQFHVGYRQTALEPGELVARICLPAPPPGSRQYFRKVGTREAQSISKVVVALVGRLDGSAIGEVRLAAGSVAPTPIRLSGVEEALGGQPANAETAALAGRLAAEAAEPIDDVRSTAAYRRWALGRIVRRMMLLLATAGETSGR